MEAYCIQITVCSCCCTKPLTLFLAGRAKLLGSIHDKTKLMQQGSYTIPCDMQSNLPAQRRPCGLSRL